MLASEVEMDPLELPPKADRRQELRYAPKDGTRVSCHEGNLATGREDLALHALNISEIGAGLALRQPLMRGQVVEIGLFAPGWLQPVRRLGTVVWAGSATGDTYSAGVVFSRGLDFAQLR